MRDLSDNLAQLPERHPVKGKVLLILVILHIIIIGLSNVMVQFPLEIPILRVYNTWGAFSYPFIFLVTDLTVRIYGAKVARRIIVSAMFPALILSYFISLFFHEGTFSLAGATSEFNIHIFRIALASFMAYFIGQATDIQIFQFVKKRFHAWWLPPACAALIGAAVDTLVFFFIAFFQSSDTFMATHWFTLGVADYVTKLVILGLFFLPLYGYLLNYIVQRLLGAQNQE